MRNRLLLTRHPKPPPRSDWYVFWPVWAICAGLLFLLGIGIVHEYLAERPKKSDVLLVVLGDGQDLHFDPGNLSPEHLRLFEARASGQAAKFIVERTKDLTIHVALASCRTCYRSHDRNYTQKGVMICGECNGPMHFESKGTKVIRNSCALVEIPHTETDRDVTVLARDVFAQAAKSIQR